MTDSTKKNDLERLGAQMKADWDRRVGHDYRFWMSDGYSSDEAMWAAGERDLGLLCDGIPDLQSKSILDIGCGVGRLLRSALTRFAEVYGVDVSSAAIDKARELLGDSNRPHLFVGDGYTLNPLSAQSIDLVVSFAALVSVPAEIVARYLVEAHRVLKKDGYLRIQLYLGEEQLTSRNDTLHLRCYRRENFERAVKAAGFRIEQLSELTLPFKVSFKEMGFEAMLAFLRREDRVPAPADEVTALLLPGGEENTRSADSDLEYWMALNYARELANSGDVERARHALEYAQAVAQATTIDVRDMLDQIVAKIDLLDRKKQSSLPKSPEQFFQANQEVLERRFPEVAAKVRALGERSPELVTKQTEQGPVIFFHAQCLDHPQKPQSAADAWVKRALQEKRIKDAGRVTVFGLGSGYHVEAFEQLTTRPVSVIEPSLEVFRAALETRDLRVCLDRLNSLWVGEEVPSGITSDAELCVRPQHHAAFPAFCAAVKSEFYGVRGIAALHPRIGVLGPLQGGTLPITAYTVRALHELKQRVREYDMSGFASGFHQIDGFINDGYRVAAVHGMYIEMLSHVIREAINERSIDVLVCMAQAPFSGHMLTELRKRGVVTVLWFLEDYLRFTYWKDVARYFDFVFTIQRGPCLEAIKAAGAGEVHYLPAACDPFVHTPQTLNNEDRARWGSPISFVGAGYHNRQQMFAALADLPFKIWGTEWPGCRPFDRLVQEQGRRLTPAEYIKIFNATEVNLNLHSSAERDGVEPFGDFVNPRTFELAAAGAFQLVDERTMLPEVFTPGKEVITFRDIHELKEKIRYYLEHPEERAIVAAAARERVLRDHTYVHRLREMLSIIYNTKFEHLKRQEDEGPWGKMLARSARHKELHGRCNAAFERGEEPILDGLVADIVNGKGKLTETEQKLPFLFHVRKQIVRMKIEELGDKAPREARRGGL